MFVALLLLFVVLILIGLCMFGVIGGSLGPAVKTLLLGIFGFLAYILPFVALFTLFYLFFLCEKAPAKNRVIAFFVFWILIGIFAAFLGTDIPSISEYREASAPFAERFSYFNKTLYEAGKGGGVIFGLPALLFYALFGKGGSLFVVILLLIFSVLLFGGRPLFDRITAYVAATIEAGRENREQDYDDGEDYPEDDTEYDASSEEEWLRMKEEQKLRRARQLKAAAHRNAIREQQQQEAKARMREEKERQHEEKLRRKQAEEEQRRKREEQAEEERILTSSAPNRRQPNISSPEPGIPLRHKLDDIHEITVLAGPGEEQKPETAAQSASQPPSFMNRDLSGGDELREIRPEFDDGDAAQAEPESFAAGNAPAEETPAPAAEPEKEEALPEIVSPFQADRVTEEAKAAEAEAAKPEEETKSGKAQEEAGKAETPEAGNNAAPRKAEYKIPPVSLLKGAEKKNRGRDDKELQETAVQLEQTLKSFGVTAKVSDINQGPAVTRFELQLGEGIKVNKIVNLADDLKLNLAAEEIRIEAPIPGKPAVGIEIPNKERITVTLRELIESPEFKRSESLLSFVVGKDIGGSVIIGDIAKMPHLMVAGTTGSGKSVFTNSIIQSILFHAKPDEVKLILIDPKVVEFSVYNGIPHLMTEVVTDPRKANSALAWAVKEMERRYKQFADEGVRGIKGYNELVSEGKITDGDGKTVSPMPQIVIVVDELADLMMVAGKEVENSICRLAQLARAAGIHLIIATQRPSADVITGLIKANMPSRVALKCGSGIDSRIILDSLGAEKLLGNGDMLYSPQGVTKPLRVQGAYVSDEEVQKVAAYLKEQAAGMQVYDQSVQEEMNNISTAGEDGAAPDGDGTGAEPDDGLDPLFEDACRLVVDKEKASSGMLQRVFKVGYNRAARIVDQMESKGVVGPEEGTKPRRVLVNALQLEELLKNRTAKET
ncbi:MAG: DNA translocase FtsK [Lachnospiraceae bacterium]|nr:DNA translocase FtsK [Lachnospiraceae bacterium]